MATPTIDVGSSLLAILTAKKLGGQITNLTVLASSRSTDEALKQFERVPFDDFAITAGDDEVESSPTVSLGYKKNYHTVDLVLFSKNLDPTTVITKCVNIGDILFQDKTYPQLVEIRLDIIEATKRLTDKVFYSVIKMFVIEIYDRP